MGQLRHRGWSDRGFAPKITWADTSRSAQAVKSTGCVVDTLTLSIEQKQLAEARIAAAGLTDSITVHLLDYRSLPESFE